MVGAYCYAELGLLIRKVSKMTICTSLDPQFLHHCQLARAMVNQMTAIVVKLRRKKYQTDRKMLRAE